MRCQPIPPVCLLAARWLLLAAAAPAVIAQTAVKPPDAAPAQSSPVVAPVEPAVATRPPPPSAPPPFADTVCEPTILIASQYGDPDHAFSSTPGSADRLETYLDAVGDGGGVGGVPPCVKEALRRFYHDGTDNPRTPIGRWYPFVLKGHPAFDKDQVRFAVLRVDVLYDARVRKDVPQSIQCFDDIRCETVSDGFVFLPPLLERLRAQNQDREQWLSINIDLLSGKAYASEVDAMGNAVPGKNYGEFAVVNEKWCRTVLASASDGLLVGRVELDMRVSYVSLIGCAGDVSHTAAATPTTVTVVTGEAASTETAALDSVDDKLLAVTAGPKGNARKVECEVEYVLPADSAAIPAWIGVQLEADVRIQPEYLNVSLWSFASQTYDEIGTVTLLLGRTNMFSTCVSEATERYIGPKRELRVRLHVRQPLMQGLTPLLANFEVRLDLLRLRVPKAGPSR